MKAPVLLRATSGPEVGIGHVARVRSVAQELQLRGVPHLVQVDDEDSVRWLEESGVAAALAGPAGELPALRSAWLDGFRTWEDELTLLESAGTPAVLVENRSADRDRSSCVVYPALHHVPDGWDTANAERVHAGAQWIPLASEVLERERRPVDVELTISFGGCDPAGLTERCLKSLTRLGWESSVRVVIGPRMEERREAIEALCAPGFEVCSGKRGLVPHVAGARRVLTAVGTTLYELAWLGVPALVLANYEQDSSALDWYSAHGPHLPLGVASQLDDGELDRRLGAALEATAGERPAPMREMAHGAQHIADLLTGAHVHA